MSLQRFHINWSMEEEEAADNGVYCFAEDALKLLAAKDAEIAALKVELEALKTEVRTHVGITTLQE